MWNLLITSCCSSVLEEPASPTTNFLLLFVLPRSGAESTGQAVMFLVKLGIQPGSTRCCETRLHCHMALRASEHPTNCCNQVSASLRRCLTQDSKILCILPLANLEDKRAFALQVPQYRRKASALQAWKHTAKTHLMWCWPAISRVYPARSDAASNGRLRVVSPLPRSWTPCASGSCHCQWASTTLWTAFRFYPTTTFVPAHLVLQRCVIAAAPPRLGVTHILGPMPSA